MAVAVAVALLLLLHVSDAILIVALCIHFCFVFYFFLNFCSNSTVCMWEIILMLFRWLNELSCALHDFQSRFLSLFYFCAVSCADVPRKWLCIYQHLAVWCCKNEPKQFQSELYICCTLQVNFIPRYAIFPKDNRLHSVISVLNKVKWKKSIQSNWK